MLNRAPSLTDQVKTYIKERIVNDAFPAGRIPPEMELAEALGVSRTTVRDALSRLEMEGTILRKQGAGTFVNTPVLQIHTRLDEIWSYEAMLRAHGFTPTTRVLDSRIRPAGDDEDSALLGLSSAEDLLVVRKLFLEDDRPAILTENRLHQNPLDAYTPDDLARPIYEFMEQFGRSRLSYYVTEIVPQIADHDVTATLQIESGTPLILFDEIGYDDDNRPILRALSYFRDDLLRLRLLRRRTQNDWRPTHG